jgi:2-oxoglutarate dehydrogenase E2 component (dihydrolipoamide succinyltransferase)
MRGAGETENSADDGRAWSENQMATIVNVPTLGESVVEGTVGKWLVTEGQHVSREQPLVEILTDKTDSEIPSPAAGVITKIYAAEGTTLPIGGKLCEIDETATAGAPAPVAAAPVAAVAAAVAAPEPPSASPATRKLARELGVDIATVKGTGAHGLITQDDVTRAAGSPAAPAAPGAAPAAAPPPARVPAMPPGAMSPSSAGIVSAIAPSGLHEALRVLGGTGAFKVPPYSPAPGDKVVPFNRRRRIIADHMVFSKFDVAPRGDVRRVRPPQDLGPPRSAQGRRQEGGREPHLPRVRLTAAVAKRPPREPEPSTRGSSRTAYVILATSTSASPSRRRRPRRPGASSRRRAHASSGLARAIDDIANKRAHRRRSPPTTSRARRSAISNPGRKGNLVGGAIISQPNVGILRIGEIKKRVVVVTSGTARTRWRSTP